MHYEFPEIYKKLLAEASEKLVKEVMMKNDVIRDNELELAKSKSNLTSKLFASLLSGFHKTVSEIKTSDPSVNERSNTKRRSQFDQLRQTSNINNGR